ncbi:hypothetical protein [Nocardia ignorata]|uniref:Methyltransferase family protein n=1 Tax=Nocardia ignorata TaxID=145285 RepID=A0A4R6P761_NOCIG|nr:hypothetical protein [Nocardia ignorata]TDP33023.1 hypothetical protein DFR75_105261 [Nocardia ignorata]
MFWAEGSVYTIGFDIALQAWRRLLTPDGVLVVTEIEWSTGTTLAFWANSYPLRTTEENTAAAQSAG